MVDKSNIGVAATKKTPEEYYKASGQLLGEKGKLEAKTPVKKATLMELATRYRTPALQEYFQKSAELGLHPLNAVEALMEKIGATKASYRVRYNLQDPFVLLADCMLQASGRTVVE